MFEKHIAYLRDNPNHYWFKAKLYGWGWTPVTWQGWAIIGLWVVAVAALASRLDERASLREALGSFIAPLVALSALLIYICYKTGEKPRWQWGPPDTEGK